MNPEDQVTTSDQIEAQVGDNASRINLGKEISTVSIGDVYGDIKDTIIAGRDVDIHHLHVSIHTPSPTNLTRQNPRSMAPKPPADFVARPIEYNALRELLLADGNAPVGITAAIRGAGGYGKTTLAQTLCHDPAIVEHFPDGILWVELAQEPGELTGRVLNLVENLIDRRPGSTTLDAATSELIKALGDKKLLLVIDDAWQAVHLTPFLQGGPHCTRLITTRINSVLPLEAVRVNVDAMQSSEATQLLGAGIRNVGDALDKLAKRLGEWPLLLRIMNAVLRERIGFGQDLKEAIADVDQGLTEEGLGSFQNTASPSERHVSVTATLNVSLRLLPELDRQRYHQLAIFPEDVDIPLITVAQLWGVSSREAKKLCFRLADLSLLLRFDLVTNTIRLHDVIRTYLCQAQPNLAELHRIFLGGYNLADWTALPTDEPYLWDRLAYHLIEAGRTEELTALFANDRWLQVRVAHDGYIYDGYLADLNQSWQQVHTTVQRQIEAGQMPTMLAHLVHHALIRASINSLSSNYEPALIVRAIETGLWSSERALSIAYKVWDLEKRVKMIIAILATHQCNEQQCIDAQDMALKSALAIPEKWVQAQALAELAPHLSETLRTEALQRALEATLAIQNLWVQVEILVKLAPHLSETLRTKTLQRTLEDTLAIADKTAQVQLVAALTPYLNETQRADALQCALLAALAIQNDKRQSQALTTLAPHLSVEQRAKVLPRALGAAMSLRDKKVGGQILAELAPYLEARLSPYTLKVALVIGDELTRVQALVALAPQLSEIQRADALQCALQAALVIRDKSERVQALVALAPQLSEAQRAGALQCALQSALVIGDELTQVHALIALALQLSEIQRTEALQCTLQAALAIRGNKRQVQALATLAPYLSREWLQSVLQAVLAIQDEWAQVRALATLAPHLSETLRTETLRRALQAALAKRDDERQAQALAALVFHLSGTQRTLALPRALEATLVIKDDEHQAQALAALAPYLSSTQLQSTLEATLTIGNNKQRQAQALAALAPYLNEAQRADALPRALAATLVIKDKWAQTQILAALAPHLSRDLLQRALDGVLAIWDDKRQIQVLAALTPHLSRDLLQSALESALAIRDEWTQAQAMVTLAPHLSDEQRTLALPRALEAALAIQDKWAQVQTLAALAPHLSETQRILALPCALESAFAIRDEECQVQALATLLPYLSDSSNLLHRIHKAIANQLREKWPTQQRQEVLWSLSKEILFQPPILDQNTLAAIAQSINEICFEWRWL